MKKIKLESAMAQQAINGFSKTQLKAMSDFSGDVSVCAGPGSGKTTVLVERFFKAVIDRKMDPERILAITFTEKAAQEMKTRLVRLCESRGLAAMRERLENASICTIDSFCSKLLKENPIEAGADPNFQILGDGESEILMAKLLDTIFTHESGSALLLRLLTDYGEDGLRQSLKNLYFLSRSQKDAEKLFCVSTPHEELEILKKSLLALAQSVLDQTQGTDLKPTEASIREGTAQIVQEIQNGPVPSDWRSYSLVENAAQKIKRMGRLKESARAMRPIITRYLELTASCLGEPLRHEFVRIFRLFRDAYDEEKKRLAFYDFTDLLLKSYELLKGDAPEQRAVRDYYRGYFSQILVDEYQDTSPLQAELIGLLKNDGNLFVVGDPLQSIYGFRQADPAVLRQRMDQSRPVALDENYRSRPELLSGINLIFKHLFGTADFGGLKPKRIFQKKTDQALGLLCVARAQDEPESLDEARVIEARTIARRIRRLVEAGHPVEERNGVLRPIRYGDIAILLRSTTAGYLYEKELFDESVPTYVVKGRGFYEKPEVRDLIHYLKWLANPDLDVSLACVLRSPLFDLSDDALFWIAREAKNKAAENPLFHALVSPKLAGRLADGDRQKLDFFNLFSNRLAANKDRYRISEIFESLLRETFYEAKLLTKPEGRLKVANVRKLIEMARAAEEQNNFGAQDFVRYIEGLAKREGAEEEAKIEPEAGDAVVLSSIHAAKGLEFACVFVADLGRARSGARQEAWTISADHGLGAKLKNPQTLLWAADSSHSTNTAQAERKEAEEEKRLLYVAMTRAKEMLTLCGSAALDPKTGRAKTDGSWMSVIMNLMDPESRLLGPEIDGSDVIDFEGLPVLVIKPERVGAAPGQRREVIARYPAVRGKLITKNILTPDDFPEAGLYFDTHSARAVENRLQITPKPYQAVRDLSVTDLLKQESASDEPYRPNLGFSDDENLPRNEFGTLFHRMMELSLYRVRRGVSIGGNFFDSLQTGLRQEEKEEMTQAMLAFWKNPLGVSIRKARRCYPELPFIYKTPYGLLKGQMDLVYEEEGGRWVVLDYKTNQIDAAGLEETVQKYEFQIGLYLLVFHELYGQLPAKGILYFSSIGQAQDLECSAAYLKEIKERMLASFQSTVA